MDLPPDLPSARNQLIDSLDKQNITAANKNQININSQYETNQQLK